MKKKVISIFIIILVVLVNSEVTNQSTNLENELNLKQEKLLDKRELKFIADDLFEKLDYLYPSVEYELKSNEIKKKIFAYIEELDRDVSETEFGKFLMKQFSDLEDSELQLNIEDKYMNDYLRNSKCLLPIQMKYSDENWYFLKNFSQESGFEGNIIKKIDDLSINLVMERLTNYVSGENISAKYSKIVDKFGFYYGLVFGYKESYTIKFENGEEYIVRGISYDSFSKSLKEPYYSFNIESNRVVRIDIKNIDRYWKYSDFLDESFEAIKNKNIEILIIDLRGSRVNHLVAFSYLTNYLFEKPFLYYSDYQRKYHEIYFSSNEKVIAEDGIKIEKRWSSDINSFRKNTFSGDVYILIDSETRGLAPLFVDFMRYSYRGYIYGEKTAGRTSAFGRIYNYRLKKIDMNIDIPTERFISANKIIRSSGLSPDKEIKQNIIKKTSGIDYQKIEALKDIYQKIADEDFANCVLEHEIYDWKLSNFDIKYESYKNKLRPYVSDEYVFKEYDELFVLQGKKYTAMDLNLLTDKEAQSLKNLSKNINKNIKESILRISEVYSGHNDKWRYLYTHTEIEYENGNESNVYKKYVFIKERGAWKLIDQSRIQYNALDDKDNYRDGLQKFRSTLEGKPVIYRYRINLYKKLFQNE